MLAFMVVTSSSTAMDPSLSEIELFSFKGSELDILFEFPTLLLWLHINARSALIFLNIWGCLYKEG